MKSPLPHLVSLSSQRICLSHHLMSRSETPLTQTTATEDSASLYRQDYKFISIGNSIQQWETHIGRCLPHFPRLLLLTRFPPCASCVPVTIPFISVSVDHIWPVTFVARFIVLGGSLECLPCERVCRWLWRKWMICVNATTF